MKSTLHAALALFALLAGALSARAQINFTITATADPTGTGPTGGYTEGQTYQFTYTLTSSFGNNGSSSFSGTSNNWTEEGQADGQLFTAVSGALGGTFTQPLDPYSYVASNSGGNLQLLAGSDNPRATGLTTLSGTPLNSVSAYIDTAISFSTPGSYTNPATSLASVLGTYPASGSVSLFPADFSAAYGFTITGLSITAIPEPSTYAALLGVGSLGWGVWRRRRAAASVTAGKPEGA
jgi:hypothetical protein